MRLNKKTKFLSCVFALFVACSTFYAVAEAENENNHNRSFWRENIETEYSHGIDATESDSVWKSNGRIEIVDGNDTIAFDPEDLKTIGEELRAINSDIENLGKTVADGKALIASALTNKGVTTDPDASFEEMAENLEKISTDPHIAYLGEGTSFNVSGYEGYENFTVAKNFLISNPYGKGEAFVRWASGNRTKTNTAQVWSNPSASYNSNTGVLSISCNTYKQDHTGSYNGIDELSAEVWINSPQVWLVY